MIANKRSKLAIIGTMGLPSKYGGFETLAEQLTKRLNLEFEISVFCSAKSYTIKTKYYNNSRLIYLPLNANGIQSVLYDILSMLRAIYYADIFLILGVSGCIALPIIKKLFKIKVLTNIDGLEWERNKWNIFAKYFLKFSEGMAVRYSDIVITDNLAIQEYVRKKYKIDGMLIEYGGDHVQVLPLTEEIRKKFPVVNQEYAISVCRIEPENNIHIILEAFSLIHFPLIVIGNFEDSEYGIRLIEKYRDSENIIICEAIYDADILDQLRGNAALYIHGHSAGGTNPSLVEAMCLGIPVLAFDVIFNRQTTNNLAEYFRSSEDLIELVGKYISRELIFESRKFENYAREKYSWERIISKYYAVLAL